MDLIVFFNSILDEKNLTVEEISNKTKIPKNFLKNLKNGDFQKFPPKVYVKGYLKDLAIYLKLDANKFIILYNEMNLEQQDNAEFKYKPILNLERRTNKFLIFLILLAFIALIIAILYMFSFNKQYKNNDITLNKKKSNTVKHTILGKKNKLLTPLADNLTDNISDNDNITKNIGTTVKSIKDNVSENSPYDGNLKKTTITKINDNNTGENNLQTLELVATDRVWLRINSDNKSIRDMILKKNDHYKIKGKKFFKIDIGNAGGIKILLDNTTFPINGKKGEVKRIFIHLDNLSKSKH